MLQHRSDSGIGSVLQAFVAASFLTKAGVHFSARCTSGSPPVAAIGYDP